MLSWLLLAVLSQSCPDSGQVVHGCSISPGAITWAGSCSVGQYVSAVNTSGTPTCSTPSGGSDPWTRVVTVGSHTNSTVTPTAVPTLLVPVAASTNYVMRCQLVTSAAAATTGVQLALTGPASPTELTWTRASCASAVTTRDNQSNAYNVDAATASAGTTRCIELVSIILRNGVTAGNVGFTLQSEIAASVTTVHVGSWCERITF